MTDSHVALHELSGMSAAQRERLLSRTEDDLSFFIQKVAPIVEAVKEEGDAALVRFAKDYDGATLDAASLKVSDAEFEQARSLVEPAVIEVLEYAADNIRRFHEAQKPGDMWVKEIRPGVVVGERYTPIDSVACYSPRGKGSFPSVTLMSAIPAVVAGVPKPVILTPPGPDGTVDPATLVAAEIAGVTDVYKTGGGQAVASVAYGTETVPKCRKVTGPGSPWYLAARQLLQSQIDTGLPAGPSEVIVMADPSANARIAALDIIIESEHGDDSSAFLVTWSEELARAAQAAIPGYWQKMSDLRAGFSRAVLGSERGGIVLAESAQQAYDFINDYAPEHLQVLSEEPFEHLPHIRNASEILLGQNAPGSIANYMMGPNCVLPTSGAAMTHSPLGVHDFMKSSSVGHMTPTGYAEMAPKTHVFATYEGFDAHANAVSSLREEAFREGD